MKKPVWKDNFYTCSSRVRKTRSRGTELREKTLVWEPEVVWRAEGPVGKRRLEYEAPS